METEIAVRVSVNQEVAVSDQSKVPDSSQAGSSPDELVQDLEVKLTEEQQSQVSGGTRVKTSDKQQQAVLDFIKG